MSTSPARLAPARYDRLDALRGAAVVWMALFHFCFDLNHYGLWLPRQHFLSDPFWTLQRTAIVTLFLFCAGLGQAAAWDARVDAPRFWRRWRQVALCALLVSLGSALMFPRTWIHFGVLHGAAVMLIATRALQQLPLLGLLSIGALALWVPHVVQLTAFDTRWLDWTGFGTRLPVTEDYVPVTPWLGVMLWGLSAGKWLLLHRHSWMTGGVPRVLRPLAALGRHSLSFYMLHQPVLIGFVLFALWLKA